MPHTIVGLVGEQYSGKSTAAKLIQMFLSARGRSSVIVEFGQRIHQRLIQGWPEHEVQAFMQLSKSERRMLYQVFGDVYLKINKDLFRVDQELAKYEYVLVPSVRRRRDVDILVASVNRVRNGGLTLVRIKSAKKAREARALRKGESLVGLDHSTETEVSGIRCQATIRSSKGIPELAKACEEYVDKLLGGDVKYCVRNG